MLKKVHVKIKKYIFRKHFQKKCEQIMKNCEYNYKFFHVMSQSFSLYFSYSQGTDTKRNRGTRNTVSKLTGGFT